MAAPRSFDRCPRKHQLPHGNCTPLRCEVEGPRQAKVHAAKAARIAAEEMLSEAAITGDNTEVLAKRKKKSDEEEFSFAEARRQFRNQTLKAPERLVGAEADRWVEGQIQNLQVAALVEQQWRLLYGNDDARNEASRLFLSAGGHGPRDPHQGGAATIIVVGDVSRKPWEKVPVTVEAKVLAEGEK